MSDLDKILQELDWIKTRLQYQNRLGLSGGRKYIAIEANKKSMWHYCDDDGTPIHESILTGYIKRLERKEGDNPKLHLFIEADYEYVLVSGFSTHFSRQAMAAIASMRHEQLTRPVIIKPDTGNEEGKGKGNKPVFCNIIQDGRLIRSGDLGKRDAEDLYQMARKVIQGSTHPSQNHQIKQGKVSRPQASTRTREQSSVDWKVFCRQYGVFPEALKDLAQELGLPHGKLNTQQTAQLYDEAWKKFVEKSA